MDLGSINCVSISWTKFPDKMGPTFDVEITNIPVEFRAATALFAGYVSDTTIRHNHIANTTYSGITLGWGCERILARPSTPAQRLVASSVLTRYSALLASKSKPALWPLLWGRGS